MGEPRCRIVFGCLVDDIEASIPEDGWGQWGEDLIDEDGDFEKAHPDTSFDSAYESNPAWIGFEVQQVSYGEAIELTLPGDDGELCELAGAEEAQAAWEAFRALGEETHQIELPEGKMLLVHDE